jgi:hypothetical protein
MSRSSKLFHAIVVVGMAATLGCSSDNTPVTDAGNDSATVKDSGTTKDVAVADSSPTDGGNTDDAFPAWLGC